MPTWIIAHAYLKLKG